MSDTIRTVIRGRRTIRDVQAEAISQSTIEEILEVAAYAPFHSKKEPWKAYMIQGASAHKEYIDKVLNCYRKINRWKNFEKDQVSDIEEKTRVYYEKIPITLIITSKMIGAEKADFEAVLATAALIQNIQLLAWDKEIGVTWRTTEDIFDSEFQAGLAIPLDERIIGTLHFTQIAGKIPKAKKRLPVSDWLLPLDRM